MERTDTGTPDSKVLAELIRYMRLNPRQHHVTVHPNGRCLIRAAAIRRFGLPVKDKRMKIRVCMVPHGAELVFTHAEGNRLVHPRLSQGSRCACIYFYSRSMAAMAASTGQKRFRFAGKGEWKPDGSFRIFLSSAPVRDFHAMLHKNSQTNGKTNQLSRDKPYSL